MVSMTQGGSGGGMLILSEIRLPGPGPDHEGTMQVCVKPDNCRPSQPQAISNIKLIGPLRAKVILTKQMAQVYSSR